MPRISGFPPRRPGPAGSVASRAVARLAMGRGGGAEQPPPPPAVIGGVAIGEEGTGIRAGYVLSWGDEFSSISGLVNHGGNLTGKYGTSRVYRGNGSNSPGAGLRAPPTGILNKMHDVDPHYTGWQDLNRGAPVVPNSHRIETDGVEGNYLRMEIRRQTAGEQADLNTGVAGQVELGAMIHSMTEILADSPAVWEARVRLVKTGPVRGWHPTFWTLGAEPPGGTNFVGNESGFEGSSVEQRAYVISWDGTGGTSSNGTTNADLHDGNWHTLTIVKSATNHVFYLDGVLKNTINVDPDANGSVADYFLLTSHVYDGIYLGESYNEPEWAAGAIAYFDCAWARCWRPTAGAHYRPLTTIPNVLTTAGGAVSITLPSQAALWGATGLTERVQAVTQEVEEPGGTNTDAYGQFPAGLSYDSGTRTLSGTLPGTKAGNLRIVVFVTGDGVTCEPALFHICAAPRWAGSTSLSIDTSGPMSPFDVYAAIDMGRLFDSSISNPKQITVGTLPAGLSYSSTTGLITGTASGAGTTVVPITATNAVGQVMNQNLTITAAALGPAPFLDWTNLAGYFTADAGVTGTTTVTAWANQETGAGDYSSIAGRQPALVDPAQNSLPGIRFTRTGSASTTDVMEVTDTAATVNTVANGADPTFTYIIAMKVEDAQTGLDMGWSATVDATNSHYQGLVRRNGSASSVREGNNASSPVDVNLTTLLANGTAYIIAMKFNGTTVDAWVNGTKEVVAASQDTAITFANMVKGLGSSRTGGGSNPTYNSASSTKLVFAEIISADAQTDGEIEAAIDWLNTKWAIF